MILQSAGTSRYRSILHSTFYHVWQHKITLHFRSIRQDQRHAGTFTNADVRTLPLFRQHHQLEAFLAVFRISAVTRDLGLMELQCLSWQSHNGRMLHPHHSNRKVQDRDPSILPVCHPTIHQRLRPMIHRRHLRRHRLCMIMLSVRRLLTA